MGKYILRRLVISVLTLWLLATASFFLLRVLPGNPFQTEKLLTLEMQQKMIHYYGLDKPMLEQYVTYMGNLLHGDMGYSMKFTNRTVNSIITSGFPVSAALGLRALAVALHFQPQLHGVCLVPHRVRHHRLADLAVRLGELGR